MIGLGMIGAGRIAQVHGRAYQNVAGARLLAVADIVKEAANRTAATFGLDAYENYHDILARQDIEAVIIAVPSPMHARIAVDAARAGKHIFCQKPIAPTLHEADQIIAACREANVLLQLGFMLRSTPPIDAIKAMVDQGDLGDLVALRASAFGWEPNSDWFYQVDKGGGVIVDTMIHFLDLWHWLGGPVQSVYSQGGAYVLDGAKRFRSTDNALVALNFADGAMGSVLASWTTGFGDLFFEVHGTRGTAFVDFLQRQTGMVYLKTPTRIAPAGWQFNQVIWSVGYEAEARSFIAALDGKMAPVASGEDGRAALELALAAEHSLRTGGVVELPINDRVAADVTAPRPERRIP